MVAFFTFFITFSYGQTPPWEIALDFPTRVQKIPCERYTTPESTINKWDWRAARYNIYYILQNGTEKFKQVDSPFHNVEGFDLHTNTIHFAHHPGEPLADYQVIDGWELLYRNFGTPDEFVAVPSFGLYNRYDARVRFFFYLQPTGEIPCQNGRILASHVIGDGAFENVSALFEHLNIPSNALTHFDKSALEVSQLNEVYCDGATWMYLEFVAAYDPCVCLHSSAVKVKPVLSAVSELNFTLTGTGESKAIYPTPTFGYDGYSKTALKYTGAFEKTIASGFKTYQAANNIKPETNAISAIGTFLPPWFSTVGAATKLLALFVGGGKSATSSKLMGFNHDFQFDGSGQITTYDKYLPILLYTPGAFYDYGEQNANRPIYDNPLGIFTILEPPVVEKSAHTSWKNGGEQTEVSFRFKGDLKYAVNQIAGINGQPIRLMGALVFPECGKNIGGSVPSHFFSTPLINIECLPDYITFGSTFHNSSYGGYSGEGCTEEPELQIVAVLENAIHPSADDILFSARYKTEIVPANYSYNNAPANPYEGMTTEEIFAVCDPPPPASIADEELIQFCTNNYNPNVGKSLPLGKFSKVNEKKRIQPINNVHPNPFTDNFVIEIQDNWVNQKITLLLQDVLGKIVWQKEFLIEDTGFLHIHGGLSSLPTGQYYVHLQGKNVNTSYKLLKQ